MEIFSGFCDIAFPKRKIKTKDKTLKRPWKSKGFQRYAKRKQKLYKKVLQKETKAEKKDTRYIKHYWKN